MAEATLQPTRRPSLYTLRQDKLDKRRRTRRRRKLTRTPKRARSEFLAMCQRLTTPGGFWLFVSPDAAAYVMRLTGGEVVPEMCVVAEIELTAAGDNVFLRLCGRTAKRDSVEAMIDAAIRFSQQMR
jgi:hypothetical protein